MNDSKREVLEKIIESYRDARILVDMHHPDVACEIMPPTGTHMTWIIGVPTPGYELTEEFIIAPMRSGGLHHTVFFPWDAVVGIEPYEHDKNIRPKKPKCSFGIVQGGKE